MSGVHRRETKPGESPKVDRSLPTHVGHARGGLTADGIEGSRELLNSIPLADGVAQDVPAANTDFPQSIQHIERLETSERRSLFERRSFGGPTNDVRVDRLETELVATRAEFEEAIRDMAASSEEQKSANAETLSANSELNTSKNELQALNEELFTLNAQLQQSVDRQRAMASDLQNVLFSTDVAALFLDLTLNIRFFTPATTALFNIILGDVGRPLADLSALGSDTDLPTDAQEVLETSKPVEREIRTLSGAWLARKILPYRTRDGSVQGVVITFINITDRKQAAEGWEEAKLEAERVNMEKSRFLAAASHDLRQPLQTLALLQGLLAQNVGSDKAKTLVARLDETLGAMGGMLNVLLDINQIEAGAIDVDTIDFSLNDLLSRLREEFSYHAQAQGLRLRVVPCDMNIHGDPRLLEQMLRNLLSNAFKYTRHGKVVLGCRRQGDMLSLQIWDTGIGIPQSELPTIFDEYHQLDNPARDRARGLGLGLSIVQRMAKLLDYRITVRSRVGKGSVFGIEMPISPGARDDRRDRDLQAGAVTAAETGKHTGLVLVIEDDPDVRGLLCAVLQEEGHTVVTASDGRDALRLVTHDKIQPDLVLADYNLPNDMDGLAIMVKLREKLHRWVPGIVLTGDISTKTSREVADHSYLQINKPVKSRELAQAVQRLLAATPPSSAKAQAQGAATNAEASGPLIFVVDDDSGVRAGIRAVLEGDGKIVEDYESCEMFLMRYRPGRGAGIIIDANLPGMNGLELLRQLDNLGAKLPAVMITGKSDVSFAVAAMKAGASDFIEKPVRASQLLSSVTSALERQWNASPQVSSRVTGPSKLDGLTPRQRQIMDMVLEGCPSKNIAADLGISQRTVENHRAAIMKKTGATSLPGLARIALAAK